MTFLRENLDSIYLAKCLYDEFLACFFLNTWFLYCTYTHTHIHLQKLYLKHAILNNGKAYFHVGGVYKITMIKSILHTIIDILRDKKYVQGHKYNTVKLKLLDFWFSHANRRMPFSTHSCCVNFLKDHIIIRLVRF